MSDEQKPESEEPEDNEQTPAGNQSSSGDNGDESDVAGSDQGDNTANDGQSNGPDELDGIEPVTPSSAAGAMPTGSLPGPDASTGGSQSSDPVQSAGGGAASPGAQQSTGGLTRPGNTSGGGSKELRRERAAHDFLGQIASRTGPPDASASDASSRIRLDPLESFSPGVFETFQPADQDRILSEFEREHLLVVTCQDRALLSDVAWLIKSDSRFSEHKAFRTPSESQSSDLHLHQLVNWHKRQPATDRTLSLVHIHDEQSFNSIRADIVKIHGHRAPGELRSSQGWMVLIVHPEAGWSSTDQRALREIPVWDLPWLPALVHDRHRRCRDLSDTTPAPEEVLTRFEAQRTTHWPREADHLCDEVMRYLSDRQEGYQTFVKELAERPARQTARVDLPDLDDLPDLHREVLFLATFFPETPTPAFDRMLETLVDGVVHWSGSSEPASTAPETPPAAISTADIGAVVSFDTSPVVATPALPTPEPEKPETRVERIEQPAFEFWMKKERRRAVMSKCGVTARRDADGERVIDLVDSSRRPVLEAAFRDGEFLKERFERLRDSRLLFDVDSALPDRVARHLIAMNCIVAEEYRSVVGDHWLYELLIGKAFEYGAMERVEALVGLIPQERRRFFFDRFGNLCAELLRHERTSHFVTNLLVELVHTEFLGISADIVFPLLIRLRSVDTFNEFEWYRRVLNSGTAELRLRVEQQFLHKAAESQGALQAMLEQMMAWHPSADSEEPRMHEQFALAFLFDFHIFWFNRDSNSEDADSSPAHPIFNFDTTEETPEVEQSRRKHADSMIAWLRHRHLPRAIRRMMGDRITVQKLDVDLEYLEWLLEPGHLIADVIHSWSNIAAELENESALRYVDTLVESLRDALSDRSLRTVRSEILTVWSARGDYCAEEAAQAPDRKLRTQLKQEKKRLSALRRKLRGREKTA